MFGFLVILHPISASQLENGLQGPREMWDAAECQAVRGMFQAGLWILSYSMLTNTLPVCPTKINMNSFCLLPLIMMKSPCENQGPVLQTPDSPDGEARMS